MSAIRPPAMSPAIIERIGERRPFSLMGVP
jgi:hypothetical protein